MLALLKRLIPDTHPIRLLWHRSKALAAAARYGFPARRLTVIGVTGTDGKTTTVGMVAHILRSRGIQAGALSTAFFRVNDVIEWNATQKTSPSPFLIQKFLRRLVNEGCTHAVIEYSSHGLLQGRLSWTWPSVAGITNLSEEHLDYHKTMEAYAGAKARLFRMLRRNGTKVLNAADRTYEAYLRLPSHWTVHYASDRAFGPPASDHECAFWATDITARPDSVTAQIRCNVGVDQVLQLRTPGAFNVDNALCAIGCAHGCGVPEDACVAALATFPGIPGRMERIDEGQSFHLFVDFTVTPQSYAKTLATLRTGLAPGKRLLVLTGSCGDRMKEKRGIVGGLVSAYADVTVVTNEDPYTEDPEKIIDEVWAGIEQGKTDAHRIVDRREAIRFILGQARPGDIVILCGKGSDTTMWTASGKVPWNEREIAREELRILQVSPTTPSR